MKKINLVCKIFGIIVLVALFCAGCEKVIPPMPTTLPTKTPFPTSTPEPTATPTEKAPPSTEWQLSPDGHIYYKESELYDGMFTINKEHPEWVEKYWEDTIRGLWNLNYISENSTLLNQFPTDDSLIGYLKNGGDPISNLTIPVIYPNGAKQFYGTATMEEVEGALDLSKIAIAIYKPTLEEIYHYSPDYDSGTRFVHYNFGKGSVFIEEFPFDGNKVLKFTLRQDELIDVQLWQYDPSIDDTSPVLIPVLSSQKTSKENLLAATFLVRSWPLSMMAQANPSKLFGWNSWIGGMTPPLLKIGLSPPTVEECKEIITLDRTPLAVR